MEFVALGEFFSISLALNYHQLKMTRKPVQSIKVNQMRTKTALPQQNRPMTRRNDDEALKKNMFRDFHQLL